MSKKINANFTIFGAEEISVGLWEITGSVIDYTLDGWSVADINTQCCFVDESAFFGTYNRWKITQVIATGAGAFVGANATSIKLRCVWDDLGEPDFNGPAAGSAFLSETSPVMESMWIGSTSLQLISEGLQAKLSSINQFRAIDRFLQKKVKNGLGSEIPKYSVLAWQDDGTVTFADASVHSVSDFAGISLEVIPIGAFGLVQKTGYIPGALQSLGALPGNYIYLSTSPGQMTLNPEDSESDTILKLGKAEPPSGIASPNAIDLHMEIEVISEP